jgi:TonB family protein
MKERQWLVEIEPWHRTFWPNLREFLTGSEAKPVSRPAGNPVYPAPRLNVEIHEWHWHRALAATFRELLGLEKEPPLRTSVKPVAVVDIWDWRGYREQFERTTLLSTLIHATVMLIVILPFVRQSAQAETQPPTSILLTSIDDIAPYKATFPVSKKKAGGGGGGGERNPLPASKGRLPRFSLQAQLAPPAAVIRNPNPRLAVQPTVVVPPDITIPNPNIAAYGDPTSSSTVPSGGPGYGGGIGTGSGGGVGPGYGPGVGPGHGGGFGGGAFRVGGNVSQPVCIYCPEAEYPEEARKARWMGTVVVWAVVDENGLVREARVQKSMGMGLDEEALRAVKSYRFKPAERFGKSVPVMMTIEVNFRLY